VSEVMLGNTHESYETPSGVFASSRVTGGESFSSNAHLLPIGPLTVDPSPLEQWYALSVRVRHEKLVVRHLQYEGITYFLPLYRSVRRWKDRRKEMDLALFPGYLFAKPKLGERWRALRAPGARQFVTFQGQPAVVLDSEIRALELSFAAGLHLQPHPYLCQGRRVRVKRGALVGTEGIMVRRKEGFRLVLSLELIMRSVMVEVDEADVEPI
jgi:transcription termination/antitermination protein NusG